MSTVKIMVIKSASDVIEKSQTICLHCIQRVKSGEKCVMYTSNLLKSTGKNSMVTLFIMNDATLKANSNA